MSDVSRRAFDTGGAEELNPFLEELRRDVLHQLEFGDNIRGVFLDITTNGVVDTEDAFTHGLGFVPTGYLVTKRDKAAHIYDGTTTWTTNLIYLRSDIVTVAATVFIF